MSPIGQAIKTTYAYALLRNFEVKRRGPKELADWEKKGRPTPPPHIVKQRVLVEYAQIYGLKILVETGTYYGDMMAAMKPHFKQLYSIELSKALHKLCVRRFKHDKQIRLIQGDSGVELKKIVDQLDQPALFWLDGHYSSGATAKGDSNTPIREELGSVLKARIKGHIVIIDDANNFGADPAYPTMEELSRYVKSIRRDLEINVKNNCIRITPRRGQ